MWSWLRRMYDSVAGRIDNTVRGWINDLLNGIYGYIHAIFNDVSAVWRDLSSWTANFWSQLDRVFYWIYVKIFWLIRHAVPLIINEYRTLYGKAVTFAQQIFTWAQQSVAWLTHYAEKLTHDAINWVIDHVWNPLYHVVTTAWNWIYGRGETLWHYITHPDLLAVLLFDALIAVFEREAFAVADRLGKFLIALIVKNLRQVAMLVEDILSAIL